MTHIGQKHKNYLTVINIIHLDIKKKIRNLKTTVGIIREIVHETNKEVHRTRPLLKEKIEFKIPQAQDITEYETMQSLLRDENYKQRYVSFIFFSL